MHRIVISILTALTAFAPCVVRAQSHFKECARLTGNDGTIIIPDRADITVDGSAIPINSEIAVFTESGRCAGVVVWKKRATGLSIWGDDVLTRVHDGFRKGETILFRIWDPSKRIEYDSAKQPSKLLFAAEGNIFKGDRSYGENAIYLLQRLSIGTETPQKTKAIAAPVLSTPLDQAVKQPARMELTWRLVKGAKDYQVQISTSSKFASKHTTAATTRSLGFSPPKLRPNVTYFWRVRAISQDGSGRWSKARRFKTAAEERTGERLAEHGGSGIDSSTVSQAGSGGIAGQSVAQEIPDRFELYPNYPNPFNPSTSIRFDLPQPSPVRIAIYNVAGAEVDVLVQREMEAGSHRVVWNALGRPSGIYYCRIQAGGWSTVRSLVLLR